MEFVKVHASRPGFAQPRSLWIALFFNLALIGLVVAFSPLELVLGANAHLVYFHGAWVWAGKIFFAIAALTGLAGLTLSRQPWQRYSLALGRVGLVFWLTYLPLSLYLQQVNWGGIFWDEPRWRIPFMFGIAGLLLQAGLWLIENPRYASIANLVFGVALWWSLGSIQNVLHPDSPITQSNAVDIQVFFAVILLLSLIFGALLTRLLYLYAAPWSEQIAQ